MKHRYTVVILLKNHIKIIIVIVIVNYSITECRIVETFGVDTLYQERAAKSNPFKFSRFPQQLFGISARDSVSLFASYVHI